MKRCFSQLVTICAVILLVSGMFSLGGCQGTRLVRMEETRTIMGTFVTITLYAENEDAGYNAFLAAFGRMAQIEAAASIFSETAEAYILNRDGIIQHPGEDLRRLVELSIAYGEITNGYFDITVQPLLDVWAAGLWQESAETQQLVVNNLMSVIGYEKIEITSDAIILPLQDMNITLGGIAKGYAAAEAMKALEQFGIKHALINAGGDIGTLGSRADGKPWRIELVNPDKTGEFVAAFEVRGMAVASSGNYERYFDPEKRISHLLNPITGYSVSDCISVTIICEDATLADVAATAVFVMGPGVGMGFIEGTTGMEGLIINNDRVLHRSSGLGMYEVTK